MPTLYLLYWDNDDANTRRLYRTPNLNVISEDFEEYSFEYILGEVKTKKYGITNKEWNINWNIDEDYIFKVLFPEKKIKKFILNLDLDKGIIKILIMVQNYHIFI